jgi:glyoxylase-like metal-dependent hydrolase (beta-lactamase superfamily II)
VTVNMTAAITRIEGDVMKVNAFLVRGPRGTVLVDGMLTVSDARKVRGAVDAGGAELAGVVITHPHPDHYAGLGHIVEHGEVPILATSDVDAVIRRDDAIKEAVVGPMMGPEWPADRLFPNQIVSDDDAVTLGGLTFRVRSLGAGESYADTIWSLDDDTVFAGDVAYYGMHAYLADGQWQHWLEVIDGLERELPASVTLHVGHGPPAHKELLGRQRHYVETFVDAVRRHADAVAAGDHAAVLDQLRRIVPNDDLLFLADLSIDPMLANLTGTD